MTTYKSKQPGLGVSKVEAIQWTGSNQAEVANFVGHTPRFEQNASGNFAVIHTSDGPLWVRESEYIVEFHDAVSKASTFSIYSETLFGMNYEVVES